MRHKTVVCTTKYLNLVGSEVKHYCVSIATAVTRTRQDVTLYVHSTCLLNGTRLVSMTRQEGLPREKPQ